jgi:hypothetical protein
VPKGSRGVENELALPVSTFLMCGRSSTNSNPAIAVDASCCVKRLRKLIGSKRGNHVVQALNAQIKIDQTDAAQFDIDIIERNARFNQPQDRIIDGFARFETHCWVRHVQVPELFTSYNMTQKA